MYWKNLDTKQRRIETAEIGENYQSERAQKIRSTLNSVNAYFFLLEDAVWRMGRSPWLTAFNDKSLPVTFAVRMSVNMNINLLDSKAIQFGRYIFRQNENRLLQASIHTYKLRGDTDYKTVYTCINSTKCAASGAGNITEPRLKLQVGKVREVVCAYVRMFLPSERWRCQYSAYVAAVVM